MTYVVIFGNIAGISTDGTPRFVFYLSGITFWSYFSETLNKVSTVFNSQSDPVAKLKLQQQLSQSDTISNLLDTYFEKNISFDAGVGEYTQSVETSVVSGESVSYNLVLDQSVNLALGFSVNKLGIETSTKAFFQQDINSSLSEVSTTTNKISYTLNSINKSIFF